MKHLPFFMLLLLAFGAAAQPKPKPRPKPPVNKPAIKPGPVPVVTASVAGKTGGKIDSAFAKLMLDFPLLLKDDKGNVYAIKQFTFIYKRKNTFEDEITGRTGFTYEWLATEMRNNEQLDDFWRTSVKESLKYGEEIHFEKILADSKKGYSIPVAGIKFEVEK